MSAAYQDHRSFAYQDLSRLAAEANLSLGPVLLAILAGAYVVFKSLDLLGYPVWLWLAKLADMSLGTLHLGSASMNISATTNTEDDGEQQGDMQRSNVLSSVFGLNSGSLLQKGVRGVTGALSKGSSNVPPGLGNWDNSCYQNSVIQGLASLPSLRDYLSKTTAEHGSLTTETTNGALFDMISKLNDPENRGQHFWIRGKLKSMSTFQQQDAQEYYSKILDALDKEVQNASNSKRRSTASWLMAAKSLSDLPVTEACAESSETEDHQRDAQNPSPEQTKMMPNPLDGLLAQRVGCTQCGYSEGLSLIPFNCVTVSLAGNKWSYDIGDCLDEYTSLEYIDGVECAKCTLLKLKAKLTGLAASQPNSFFATRLEAVQEALEDEDFEDKTLVKNFNVPKKLWEKSTKSKQAVIARAPKSLVLHVNRSIFDEMTGAQYKNNAGVEYPTILDLGRWCLGSKPSDSQLPDNSVEEWPRDPNKSMVRVYSEQTAPSPFQYRLRAAVTHFGTHGNGHYVCYRPHPSRKIDTSAQIDSIEQEGSSEQWWRFSDDTVYTVPESQAHQGNVFMLFYERIDEAKVLPNAESRSVTELITKAEEAPLPPSDIAHDIQESFDNSAVDVPLPSDGSDSLALSPSASPILSPKTSELAAYPTPPETPTTFHPDNTSMSEADSEDVPSTQLTSDPKFEMEASTPHLSKSIPTISPHLMRTAGDSPSGGQGNRASLPMVTAT